MEMSEPTGAPFNLLELGLALATSVGASAAALWKAAAMVGKAEEKLNSHSERLDAHDEAIEAIDHKNDVRHEENRRDQSDLREKVARLPDKDDFRRLEDLVRGALHARN